MGAFPPPPVVASHLRFGRALIHNSQGERQHESVINRHIPVQALILLVSVFTSNIGFGSTYPTFSINNTTITETDSGFQSVAFSVSLSGSSSETLAVRYETVEVPGSSRPDDYANQSARAGSDFVHTNGVLTFNPGETSKTITVSIVGDAVHEYDEGFVVQLSQASPAPVDRSHVRAIIENDDILEITINNVTMKEGNSGETVANFSISLSRETDQYLVGTWFTANSSAESGSDLRGAGGSIQYPSSPGQTNMALPISIFGDRQIEDDEVFFVHLSVNMGIDCQIGNPGQCRILNDDFLLKTESSSAQEITFRLEGALGATHVIEYSTNFTDWTRVSTNRLFPERVLRFATQKNKQGFYRAVLHP